MSSVLTDLLGRGAGLPLAPDKGRLPRAEGTEKVRQSILIILDTEPGERVMLPEFGCGLRRFLMQPNGAATRAGIERAVRDALPFLRQAKEVLVVEIGENNSKSQGKKSLADVTRFLGRHGIMAADEIWKHARGPAATELTELVRAEKADMIVAGGYGHSRLGEWIFGGVTHQLLASSPVCCMLSH